MAFMAINSINFKGTFCIPQNVSYIQNRDKIISKKEKYQITEDRVIYDDKINEVHLTVPDTNDAKIKKFLDKKNIPYFYFSQYSRLDKDEIYQRLIRGYENSGYNYELTEVDTKALDNYLKDKPGYIGYKSQGDPEKIKYDRAVRFLHTNHDIIPSKLVTGKDFKGNTFLRIDDGRHRFAVLRDIGMKKIPVMMSYDALEFAKEERII